ncbi:predicted protein [Botrytis cinerea T4]|uniref:Uncharacterized protein n=1 Tax=Botryotinia fuckeliana (strain T4) TaxID=999810 RepID=G2XUK5_BOTF4|nr:predicted protein [Botrytis cinerea T4]
MPTSFCWQALLYWNAKICLRSNRITRSRGISVYEMLGIKGWDFLIHCLS